MPKTKNRFLQAHGHDDAEVVGVGLVHQAAGAVLFVDLEDHHVAEHGVQGLQEIPGVEADLHGQGPGIALLHKQAHHFPAFAHLRVVEGDFQVVRHQL